jgi:endogenous inhibitor of DNA gyrase (YacG/DUF329 family)
MSLECPICGKVAKADRPAVWPQFPFCSPRCRLIDLGRWLGEAYRLPAADEGQLMPDSDDDGSAGVA